MRHPKVSWIPMLAVALWVQPSTAQEKIEQWALRVVAVSSATQDVFKAEAILGFADSACETSEGYTHDLQAWRTATPDKGREWIEIQFANSVFASVIDIHQSLNPGAITSVALRDSDGELHTVWSGQDSTKNCPGVLHIEFPSRSFSSNIVYIELDTERVPGWNQIDAVRLAGFANEAIQPILKPIFSFTDNQIIEGSDPDTFVDFDNDGWPDLLTLGIVQVPHSVHLRHNEGNGTFAERAQTLPIRPLAGANAGRLAADYDNDGDLDLFIPGGSAARGVAERNFLLRNDRGHFRDVTAEAGLADSLVSGFSLWFDYDKDSFLDLYIGHWDLRNINEAPNMLFKNMGNGQFKDVTAAVGLGINLYPNSRFNPGSGTASGAIAADFNNDTWLDLYIPVFGEENKLFLNDGAGHFVDGTTREIADIGTSSIPALGDFDNDGHLDIFQPSLGLGDDLPFRAFMLLALGNATFLDVTEGIGLGPLTRSSIFLSRLADMDNDGDLDLMTHEGASYFVNNGDGSFTDQTFRSGYNGTFAMGDFDGNGALDIWSDNTLYSIAEPVAHSLRIRLEGTQSNRSGIGARLVATAGDLVQTTEFTGSLSGNLQDDMFIHFGLADHTSVDQLEIRWPSGQVDFIDNIPADQEIRVIEGRSQWYPAPRSIWTVEPPATLNYGREVHFVAEAKPTLFEPTATITSVTADLSSLGGPEALPLVDQGNDTYRLEHTFTVGGESDLRDVEVFILQETSLGEHWINLSRNINVEGDPNTAVLEDYSDALPAAFTLHQNHPNPFNSGTVIRFALPQTEEVELSVFNIAGQKVATLIQGLRQAGSYAINWDGRSDVGKVLATGIYFYQLNNGQQVETKKLMLLR